MLNSKSITVSKFQKYFDDFLKPWISFLNVGYQAKIAWFITTNNLNIKFASTRNRTIKNDKLSHV